MTLTLSILFAFIWLSAIFLANQDPIVYVEIEDVDDDDPVTSDSNTEFVEYVKCDPLIFQPMTILPVLVTEEVEEETKEKED